MTIPPSQFSRSGRPAILGSSVFSRRKRGPVTFRPRLSTGLALSIIVVIHFIRSIVRRVKVIKTSKSPGDRFGHRLCENALAVISFREPGPQTADSQFQALLIFPGFC